MLILVVFVACESQRMKMCVCVCVRVCGSFPLPKMWNSFLTNIVVALQVYRALQASTITIKSMATRLLWWVLPFGTPARSPSWYISFAFPAFFLLWLFLEKWWKGKHEFYFMVGKKMRKWLSWNNSLLFVLTLVSQWHAGIVWLRSADHWPLLAWWAGQKDRCCPPQTWSHRGRQAPNPQGTRL